MWMMVVSAQTKENMLKLKIVLGCVIIVIIWTIRMMWNVLFVINNLWLYCDVI